METYKYELDQKSEFTFTRGWIYLLIILGLNLGKKLLS